MGLSVWQIAIVALVVLVLFGRGRISEMMGDFGKGISSFKKGMSDEVGADEKPAGQLESPEAKAASETTVDAKPADSKDAAS